MNRPQWMRIQADMFDNPKIMRAQQAGGDETVCLYLRALGYAVAQLTDGWIPLPLPARWGYRAKHTRTLEHVGLWHPMQITDDGGWLINDYADFQITRQEWEHKIEQRRSAARKRWSR